MTAPTGAVPMPTPTTKLWQKGYTLDALASRYTAGDEVALDNRLVEADVWGSMAHARMLHRIGILTEGETNALLAGLARVLDLYHAGEFVVAPEDEDVHTKVENYLTATAGEAGKKIHTARSRNDQVLVDLRLWAKGAILDTMDAVLDCAATFAAFAVREQWTPMPGYTHMQRAMPSSAGLWAAAFAESLLDDLDMLKAVYRLNDQNPLGSAASYGVNLPIDRQMTTDLLGFGRVQNNVLYAQNTRGKFEGACVQALAQVMLDLSKFAQDMMLFLTSEYNFFRIAETLATGSSIMPQKRNPDVMELVRARAQGVLAAQTQIFGLLSGLPSGYNMDFGETKGPTMRAFDTTNDALSICALTLAHTTVNAAATRAANTPELYATDQAYALVAGGVPFRDAYRRIAKVAHDLPAVDIDAALRERTHLGTVGNLGLDRVEKQIEAEREFVQDRRQTFTGAIGALVAHARRGMSNSPGKDAT